MKIYTKTGDQGETGLWGGGRIVKDAARIHAYGTVDECNAILGIVRTVGLDKNLDEILGEIQNTLFVCGADLATPGDKATAIDRIGDADVRLLEKWIDEFEGSLIKLKNFILPGGSPASAYLHLARTVCRRAERWTVKLVLEDQAHKTAAIFLNRLSDFLFVAARTANRLAGSDDIDWRSPRQKNSH